ncbi:hypothetical protein D3C76_859580 [compost metagenome]
MGSTSTPVASLIRWCVERTFFSKNSTNSGSGWFVVWFQHRPFIAMSAWLMATSKRDLSLPRFGMITSLINWNEVPRSLLLPSRITITRSINNSPLPSFSYNFATILRACLSSASLPSPNPGESNMLIFRISYLVMVMVSGSTPCPTFAASVLNKALMVEDLPQPVAPTIRMLIFVSFSLAILRVISALTKSDNDSSALKTICKSLKKSLS